MHPMNATPASTAPPAASCARDVAPVTGTPTLRVRRLGRVDYGAALAAMRGFTASRDEATVDEVWLLEHPPVFTQGLAGRPEHVLTPGAIPVVATERGGQVTFHGPGQVIAYTLVDLRRRGLAIREFVCRLEQAAIDTLAGYGVAATRRPGAPGVYLRGDDGAPGAKIASLGLKVTRGRAYHGLALNAAMDLEPFARINPCGHPGLAVVDIASCVDAIDPDEVAGRLGRALAACIEGSR